jgi:hypothetical protein
VCVSDLHSCDGEVDASLVGLLLHGCLDILRVCRTNIHINTSTL